MLSIIAESPTYSDGTYAITDEGISNYGERWAYGYMVGVESLRVANVGRYPTGEELRTLAGKGLVGVWKDSQAGRVYVDRVRHIDTLAEALKLAKELGELAIWDLRSNSEIRLDTKGSN